MKHLAITLSVLVFAASSANAQGRNQQQTKSFQGMITAVQNGRILWEVEGQTGPLPYDRGTQWNITANGDGGFLTVGSVVTVSGMLRAEDKRIIAAQVRVHRNPRETARPEMATVQTADPLVTVKGQVVSREPLAIKTIDGITMIKGSSADGPRSKPVYNAVLKVEPTDAKLESVGLILGSAPQFVSVGDQATVTVNAYRPNVAASIAVRKSEPLKSEASKKADDKTTAKTDTESTTETGAEEKTEEAENESSKSEVAGVE